MPALTTQHLAQITAAVYKKVDTKAKQKRLNSKKRPFLEFFLSRLEETTLEGGSVTFKNQVESSIQETTWVGDDEIEASEPDFILDLEFGYFNFNVAIRILHDQLKRLGFTILPNGTGTLEDRAMSKSEGLKLVNYIKKLIEEAMDAYDRRLDLLLHRSGSQSATVQAGLFGILPTSATTGSIGGKTRSAYTALQHQVQINLSVTNGGTLRSGIDRGIRSANLFGVKGAGVPGEIDRCYAGQAFIEGYKAWAEANNWHIHRDAGTLKKLDISIGDAAVWYGDIPIIHNPTMDTLDSIDTSSPTYTKQAAFLNSQTWQPRNETKMHKHPSSPQDPPNKRLTRMDLDGTYVFACDAPASNLLASIV